MFDFDGSGKLDEQELARVLAELGHNLRPSQVHRMLVSADTNCDGFVSLPEMAYALGYRGKVPDNALDLSWDDGGGGREAGREVPSGSKQGKNSSNNNDNNSSSSSSSIAEPEGHLIDLYEEATVAVVSFYTDERVSVTVCGRETFADVAARVGEAIHHPAHRLRFYVRGFPVENASSTLHLHGVRTDDVITFVYLPDETPFSCLSEGGLEEGTPDLARIYAQFRREGRMEVDEAVAIVRRATALLATEPNVVEVEGDAVIIGDIHGTCVVGLCLWRCLFAWVYNRVGELKPAL